MNPSAARSIAQAYCLAHELSYRKPIGTGASKHAFLVEGSAGPVALKIADIFVSQTDRLVRETDTLRSCNHLGIARIHSAQRFAWGAGQYWVVIEEYLGGGTLDEQVRSGVIDHAGLLVIARKLASVIGYLQSMSLVHRDIKPANIMFRSSLLEPVLTDFGIVRVLNAPSLTQDFLQQGPGTPFYAAPEQLNNDKALIDWRTDQFCLAASIAHCVLAHHPFQLPSESPHDAIARVARRESLPPPNLEALKRYGFEPLGKAMHAWPVGRYCTPVEFTESLDY